MRKRKLFLSLLACGIIGFSVSSCGEIKKDTPKDAPIVEPGKGSNPDEQIGNVDKPEQPNTPIDNPVEEPAVEVVAGDVKVLETKGMNESAKITWQKQDKINYNVYFKESSNNDFTKLDNELIREENGICRADALGLKKGIYDFRIVPVLNENEEVSKASVVKNISVSAYDRSGYAHFNYNEGVGAYNNDGTLKDNAIVIYVTDENKNTVELKYGSKTVKGIGNILNSVGEKCGEAGHEDECKKVADKKTYYGKANDNQGILKDLALNNIPLVVRFVGCVSDSGLYKTATNDASKASLIEGLTAYDSVDFGGSKGDNGHMARMKSASNLTLEGVGDDAIIDGWGFHLICETSNPELAKNFEVRNLAFINTPEDAIGMEGQQKDKEKLITAGVERCFIHHNTFIGPDIANPAESDKAQGDGSCDFKRGQYFTCSYNYYESCHKTNLVGSSDASLQYNLSYHHNIWYNCESRMPLLRQANTHFYNNYFIGGQSASYISDVRANGYLFAEANYYEGCKNVINGVDAGAGVKLYNNVLVGTYSKENINNYIVTDREAQVSTNTAYQGISYENFDTNKDLFYYDVVNKKSDCYLTSPEQARLECLEKSGSNYRTALNKTVIKTDYSFYTVRPTESIDLSTEYNFTAPSKKLEGMDKGVYYTNISGVKGNTVKFKNVGMTFKIDSNAILTLSIETSDKTALASGYVVNVETGEIALAGSGTANLKAGTYSIVSSVAISNLDGSKKNNSKESTVTALKLVKDLA